MRVRESTRSVSICAPCSIAEIRCGACFSASERVSKALAPAASLSLTCVSGRNSGSHRMTVDSPRGAVDAVIASTFPSGTPMSLAKDSAGFALVADAP